jgi:hypothetical protein
MHTSPTLSFKPCRQPYKKPYTVIIRNRILLAIFLCTVVTLLIKFGCLSGVNCATADVFKRAFVSFRAYQDGLEGSAYFELWGRRIASATRPEILLSLI